MGEIKIFENAEFGNIRIIVENDKILFCPKDVATALGYSVPRKAIWDHCRGVLKRNAPTSSGEQQMSFVYEGDVYRLIMHSRLSTAERFEKWVTDDVLPSIRKHGAYMTAETIEKTLTDPDFIIKLASTLKEEKERRLLAEAEIEKNKPKLNFYDKVVSSNSTVPVTIIAKDYGMTAKAFNELLHNNGVQYKVGKTWVLYNEYAGKGYTDTYTYVNKYTDETSVHTRWTQAGREFIYNKLGSMGIFPVEAVG